MVYICRMSDCIFGLRLRVLAFIFLWDGRVVRRCWVNFRCWGVLLIWIILGQGPIVLAVGAGGGCLDSFSLIYHFCLKFLSPSLWETARYRLKYCLKGPLTPKQPTNQIYFSVFIHFFSFRILHINIKNLCWSFLRNF